MEFSHRSIIFNIFILGAIFGLVHGEVQDLLVDQLTSDYLKIEQSLWRVVEKREPTTLQQIYNIHTRFMNRNHGESNVLRNETYMKHNESIAANINVIDDVSANLVLEFFINRNYVALSAVAVKGIQLEHEIDAIIAQTVNNSIFWEDIQNITQKCHDSTDVRESQYQTIIEYYKDMQALALKTYISTQLSYMLLRLHESGDFHLQSDAYRQRFIDRNFEVKDAFREQLELANVDVLQCVSLADQNAGVNTVNVTSFLQGFIENEVVLNAEASCTLTCADYRKTTVTNCLPGSICETKRQRTCNGVLRNCHGIADNLDVCLAEANSTRRYNWARLDSGNKIGVKNAACSKEFNVKSWIRWFVKCSNCFCLCDDEADSDRYVSLLTVVSNIFENKIVTGVGIEKVDGVIQFRIVERDLFSVLHGVNLSESNTVAPTQLDLSHDGWQDGLDYHKLTYEHRTLSLDTLTAPPGHAITGIRFQLINKRLTLQIRATAFSLVGQLENLANSTWISRASEHEAKHEIKLNGRRLSTKATQIAIPNETNDAYVEFGPTDFTDDLAQHTIPLIDGHLVEPKVPAVLSGIGLIHKGQSGFGGYIAPKLIVYKFQPTIPHSDE